MDTKLVKTVAMFGPSLSDPTKTVNRDIPEADVQAYKAAGYKVGSIVIDDAVEPAAVVYTDADAIEQNEGLDESPAAKGKKGK